MARSWSELLGEENAAPEPEAERAGLFSAPARLAREVAPRAHRAARRGGVRSRRRRGVGAARGGADRRRRRRAGHRRARAAPRGARPDLGELGAALAEEIESLLGEPGILHVQARPTVILVVGVNGTGKTTTIGKLGEAALRARALRRRRGRRHVPRRRRGAARDLGEAGRRGLRRLRARRRPGRGRLRRDRGRAGPRARHRDRRHRGPPAHPDRT